MRPVLMLVAVVALFLPASLEAQRAPLDQVETYANEGRVPEARATLERWWDRERPRASRAELQRALWLRGILTLDPELAENDYQRLVLEFPGGPYSDRALLRLGQAAHAADDLAVAARYYRDLMRDYPGSRLRDEAEEWLSRFGGEPAARPVAPLPGADSRDTDANPDTADPDVADSRGRRGSPSEPDGRRDPRADPRTRGQPPAPPEARRDASTSPGGVDAAQGLFGIQLGAFQSEDGARRLVEETAAAGLDVRMVRTTGSDLVRVRTGSFPTRDAAAPVLARLRARGIDGFIVTDVANEVPHDGGGGLRGGV